MSFRATIQKHYLDSPKVLDRAASVFTAAPTNIFTVVRGHILAIAITGRVEGFAIAGGINTFLQVLAPGAVAMSDNLYDIDTFAVGTNFMVPGNVALPITSALAAVIPPDLPWDCIVGSFTCTTANAITPGTIAWSLAYLPCTEDTIVIVA